jgi:hypothetical protein
MNLRGLFALALLLIATCMERFGYYGSRSFLSLDLRAEGATVESIGMTMTALQGLVLVGMIIGGAAAFGIGPRATAAVGALLAAIGHFALAAGAPVVIGAGVVAFGAGVFRPCTFAAAAETLAWDDASPSAPGPHRFAAVTAFAVLSYAAVNVGSLLSPMVAGALRNAQGNSLVHGVDGGVLILAAMIAGLAAVLGLFGRGGSDSQAAKGPYRDATVQPSFTPAPPGQAVAGLAILLVPQGVFLLATTLSTPPRGFLSGRDSMWLYSVNPVVVTIVSMMVFTVLLIAVLQRWTLPPLLIQGAGLVIFSLGLIPIAFAGTSSVALYALGEAITGVGEPPVFAVPVAYAAIAVRGRAAALVVAGWLSIVLVMSMLGGTLNSMEVLRTPLLGLCALLGLGGGAALIAFARTMHRTFFDPPQPARPAFS